MRNIVAGAIREEVKSKAGATVDLPCVINQNECGDFHSIKWYKENRRVYVYSPIANFAKAEGELVERGTLIFEGNNSTTRLQIKDLNTKDEGEYKCEITFLDITKDCPVVQLVKLTTLGKQYLVNYVGVRIHQGIRMIKLSEMRPLGSATFWDNHLPAVTMILTPILVSLKPKILPNMWCHFL